MIRIAKALWWSVGGTIVLALGLVNLPLLLESKNETLREYAGLALYLFWLIGTFFWMFITGLLRLVRPER